MSKAEHLIRFKVDNFKRFRSLELNDLGQFNVIIGDNNVGKTSLLEALLFDQNLDYFSGNLLTALKFKNLGGGYKEGHFSFFMNRDEILEKGDKGLDPTWEFLLEFKLPENNNQLKKVESVIGLGRSGGVYIDDPFMNDRAEGILHKDVSVGRLVPLIPFSMSYAMDLSDIYSKYYVRDRIAKRRLLKALAVFIPDIEEIEVDTAITDYPVLVIARKGLRSSIPLVSYGDGTIKLFRILMYLLSFRGKRLMIDEVDTGVHYSRMKSFWAIILKVAEANDVQLFVTTHNKECIKYFFEALFSDELAHLQDEARTITLVENAKTKDVEALTSEFFQLEHALEVGNEIR